MKPNKTPRKHAAFASSSRQMKRRPKVKSLLAVLVAFCTVCALTMPAATLEGQAQASCGLAEHTHDESCYESVLVCGQEESEGHVHDESCYEEVLTCEIPEHTHSEACWAQPETQAEAGNEENSEAVTGDGAGSDMEADAGTETGTDTEADTGTGTGTDSSENGDAAEAGSETDSSGNAGTGAGDNGSAESGAESGDGQTGNGGAGSEADGTGENGSGTENAGEQDESTSDEDALTEEEKTEEAENPQAAEEAAEMPDGAAVPDGYTEQYTVRDEENGFAVTVYAPEGVVPEGAVLSAELLSEETEEYAAAEQELAAETEAVMAENGVSALSEDGADAASEDGEAAAPSYGFAALDIHFEYENGEEVEPNGDVYVVIDAAGLLPEDADPESVTVQHHAEQEDGSVAVETVADTADATNGVVAVVVENADEAEAKADVQAAFEVDGFSRFTITWRKPGSPYQTYFNVNVHYVDQDGEELNVQSPNPTFTFPTLPDKPGNDTNQTYPVSDSETFNFNDYIIDIGEVENCTAFKGIHYGSVDGETVDNMTATISGEYYYSNGGPWGIGKGWYTRDVTRTLTFKNEDEPVATETYSNRGDSISCDIYFVYEIEKDNPGGGSTTITPPEPQISKRAVSNGDGTYDLSLSVTGSVGSQQSKVNIDVLMIVDESNSMGTRNFWGEVTDKNGNLIPLLENAMRALVNELESNEEVSARYSIVSFGTTGDLELDWTFMPEEYQNIDNTIVGQAITGIAARGGYDGGTNYMAGLQMAKPLLDEANADSDRNAITVVVFLSDGEPTYYYDNSTVGGDGQNALGTNSKGWQSTLDVADDFYCDQYYSVGIGDAMSSYLYMNNQKGGLAQQVHAGNRLTDRYVEAEADGSNLAEKFEEIAGSVTDLYIENVTITDKVNTTNVQQVMNTDGTPTALLIVVTNENGDVVTDAEVTAGNIQANYENGVLKLDFDDNYQLKPGYTYTVTMKIEPTPEMISQYGSSQNYPDSATENWDTGTHTFATGDKGIYSNENATLTYYYSDNPQDTGEHTLTYPMPVIQVPEPVAGDLTITKEVVGPEVNNKEYSFTISTEGENVAGKQYLTSVDGVTIEFLDPDEDGIYTASVTVSATTTAENVDGSITISSLPIGEYWITETTESQGDLENYEFDSVSYKVGETENETKVMVTADNQATIEVTNSYIMQLSDIIVNKVDNSNNPLKGAQFQLKNEADKFYTVSSDSTGKITVTWEENAYSLESQDNSFEIHDLPNGTYTLIETVAPEGYNLPEKDITFTIEDGIIISALRGSSVVEHTSDSITVTNTTGESLPETGGPGTTILTIGGLLLMAGAVGGGYGLRRRRGKEGR